MLYVVELCNGSDDNCNGELKCGAVTDAGAPPWAALVYLAPLLALAAGRRRIRRS